MLRASTKRIIEKAPGLMNEVPVHRDMNLSKSTDTKADLSAKVVLRLKALIMIQSLLQWETRVFFSFFWSDLLKMTWSWASQRRYSFFG